MSCRALAATTVVLVLALAAGARAGVVVSSFDHGLDGWTLSGGPAPGIATWRSAGGHPAGFAQSSDDGTGDERYWTAPPAYAAAAPLSYGGALGFDRIAGLAADRAPGGDIVIRARDTTTLRWSADALTADPGPLWARTTVALLPAPQWTDRTGAPATEDQLRHVLATLQTLEIAERYTTEAGTDGLDNVVLAYTAASLPAAAKVIALAPTRRSCSPHAALTIRIAAIKDVAYRSAAVFVGGHRVRLVRSAQLRAPLHLTGLPRGRFTVRVVVTTADERTLERRRTYRRC